VDETMEKTNIQLYGTQWCGDCLRALNFLKSHHIEYQWIDIDLDKKAEQFVLEINHGMRSVPTILFEDGSILVEPSTSELARKFGF
jgi:mycoredoxin